MTIKEILMPKLGESVTEGIISLWRVKPGDVVKKYAPLAEVLTDKVVAEIPSSYNGTVVELLVKEDEAMPVGVPICTMEVQETATEQPQPSTEPVKGENKVEKSANKSRFSPVVQQLAQEHAIDLALVNGTGHEGRITRKDVLDYMQNPSVVPTIEKTPITRTITTETISTTSPVKSIPISGQDISIPVDAIRKTIAKRMVQSVTEIPHAWTMIEVDTTNMVNYRNKVKNQFKSDEGFALTYFAFFIKAVASALKTNPTLNSCWDHDKIIQKHDVNISIAVAKENSLYVPVIKNADEKSIKGIAKEIWELSQRVQQQTITAEEMTGGTFTVNNTGSFGSIQSMGIINQPQAAILQVEAITPRPWVIDGNLGVRQICNLCLSIDHRILDGLMAGRFLQTVKSNIEQIDSETTHIY